jgi:hypothetical protein
MGQLSDEVRAAVSKHGNGELTHEVLANLPLLDSVIYETLRTQPPIAVQVRLSRPCSLANVGKNESCLKVSRLSDWCVEWVEECVKG